MSRRPIPFVPAPLRAPLRRPLPPLSHLSWCARFPAPGFLPIRAIRSRRSDERLLQVAFARAPRAALVPRDWSFAAGPAVAVPLPRLPVGAYPARRPVRSASFAARLARASEGYGRQG